MKAEVKDTGEMVNVVFALHPNPAVDEAYWWCEDNQTSYHKSELVFMGENIDWEQRRYEIAKDCLAGYTSNSSDRIMNANVLEQIETSIEIADVLIDKLKGGKK